MDFSTGGWLIGGRPTGLLIWGDHLFLNYIFFWGNSGWLIGRGLLILTWHYPTSYISNPMKKYPIGTPLSPSPSGPGPSQVRLFAPHRALPSVGPLRRRSAAHGGLQDAASEHGRSRAPGVGKPRKQRRGEGLEMGCWGEIPSGKLT